LAEDSSQQSWAKFARGDREVWQKFITTQIPRLYGTFIRQWPNPSLAEELVQKTIFDAVQGRTQYDPAKGSPEEWTSGIARNNIRLEIRRRVANGSLNSSTADYIEQIDDELLPDEVLERKETAELVKKAISTLDVKEQAVLKAKYIDQLSADDIARQSGTSVKAVHSLLYRAKVALRKKLKHLAPLMEGQKL